MYSSTDSGNFVKPTIHLYLDDDDSYCLQPIGLWQLHLYLVYTCTPTITKLQKILTLLPVSQTRDLVVSSSWLHVCLKHHLFIHMYMYLVIFFQSQIE